MHTDVMFCRDYLAKFGTRTDDARTLEILRERLTRAVEYTELLTETIHDCRHVIQPNDPFITETAAELAMFRDALDDVRGKLGN